MAACCCSQAQTAQLEGKEEVAHLKFRQMLERPDAEFVGLRGLLAQAMKTGDYDEALDPRPARLQAQPDHALGADHAVSSSWVAPGSGRRRCR